MIITYCIDKNYIDYARVSIASYRQHNPEAKIIIVSQKPIQEQIGQDENIVIQLPREMRSRGKGDRITNTAYLKCFLTLLKYKKIIYVDADTICQAPLKELWEMPCAYINLCESYSFGRKQAAAIGAKRYGLTGMMVMNLETLRMANFTEECMKVEQTYPTPATGWQHDETCINVAMKSKLTFISQKWNYCHNKKYENPIEEESACILHFVGHDKMGMIKGTRYSTMSAIGKYITGRTVAIVGNAKSLFDSQYGPEIDVHDFVIRFNKGFIKKPESQGVKTDLVMLAVNLTENQIESYHSRFIANRSRSWDNKTNLRVPDRERARMVTYLGAQPSTGFIAIDMCIYFDAKQIDLYGFDFEETPTFYNPEGYVTQHKYANEKDIVERYERMGILRIHKKSS